VSVSEVPHLYHQRHILLMSGAVVDVDVILVLNKGYVDVSRKVLRTVAQSQSSCTTL